MILSTNSGLRIKIGPTPFYHIAEILPQFLQRRTADIPPATVDLMNREVRHQTKRIRNGNRPVDPVGGINNIKLLDRLKLTVAEKRKIGAQSGPKGIIDFRWVNADNDQLAIAEPEFLLKLGQEAQLHLTLPSPVAPIKDHDEGELARNIRELDPFLFMVRELQVREALAY